MELERTITSKKTYYGKIVDVRIDEIILESGKITLRELMEETGYGAKTLNSIGEIWASPGFTDEYMNCYIARDLFTKKLPHDDEEISIRKIPMLEAHTLIKMA